MSEVTAGMSGCSYCQGTDGVLACPYHGPTASATQPPINYFFPGEAGRVNQIPLIDGVVVQTVATPEPPAATIYLVLAYRQPRDCGGRGYWKVHRETHLEEHADYDAALAHAHELGAAWTHRRIVRIATDPEKRAGQ